MKHATIAIHESQKPDPVTGAVITPIYQTTTFAQDIPGVMKDGYDYSRSGNPTRAVLENVLARMEGGKHGFTFASGMGALTTLMMAFMQSGDHIVVGDDVYGGTFRLFDKCLKKFGITATYVDMTTAENVRAAITDKTKMVFLETPTNPLLKLADLDAIIKIAKENNIFTCVDNTFATPILQNPLKFGADCVLHSTTKYINGHSDVVGGALIVNTDDHADTVRFYQNSLGATPDVFACWLTLRGLKTLKIRMDAHVAGAMAVANFLQNHDGVEEVIYPGLESFPQHDLAQKQMKAAGGMIAVRLKGDGDTAVKFLQKLQYFTLAESLGGIESLVEIPALMTHMSISEENRAKLGITDTLIRISVGIEDPEDLIADLTAALS